MTSPPTPRSISSPASAAGPMQLDLLAGLTPAPCGPEAAPANRSRSRAKVPELLMNGICGPTFTASSVPDGPLSSWESRLRERLAMVGSTESALIWREKVTPAGESISRLAPWTPPISAAGSTGSRGTWVTPAALDGRRAGTITEAMTGRSLAQQINTVSVWPTPKLADFRPGHISRADDPRRSNLNDKMMGTRWPTATASNGATDFSRQDRTSTGQNLVTVMAGAQPVGGQDASDHSSQAACPPGVGIATWVTPSARDWKDSPGMARMATDGRERHDQLPRQMCGVTATWPTPVCLDVVKGEGHDRKMALPRKERGGGNMLNLATAIDRTAHSGPAPNGSSATMGKRGAPSPAFPAWLMGYPPAWLDFLIDFSMPRKRK